MIEKIYNTIKQWLVVRWCTKWVAWCFRWLCFIARSSWRFFIKHILDRLLISIIFVGGVIMLALAVRLFWKVRPIWWDGSELKNPYDHLQPLIWSIGGVGAAIGLWFANQRQKTSSEQVQVQVDQSFNDKLGRGVELLADEKNVVMRCAGLQVLEDLADNANGRQRAIVLNIIYNFFRDNAKANMEDGNEPCFRAREDTTQDLQDALDILINLSLNDRKKLLPKRLVAGRLNFCKLDFSHLVFANKTLENINFSQAIMEKANFFHATIKDVNFTHAIINEVEFTYAIIENVDFTYAIIKESDFGHGNEHGIIVSSYFISTTIENSTFSYVTIENANFSDVEIMNTTFNSVEFMGGILGSKKKMKISSQDDLPEFFCTEFGYTEFDFANKTNSSDFFESCYCRKGLHLPFLNDGEKYEHILGRGYVFIDGSSWPGENVPKRIEVEITRRKLQNRRDLLQISEHSAEMFGDSDKRVRKLKDEVEDLEKKLRAAEADLESDTKKHNPKTKNP